MEIWQKKPVKCEIGSTTGRYFTQWRIATLQGVADRINAQVPINNCKLWYDDREDYHILEFDADDQHFILKYYKVFALYRHDKPNEPMRYPQNAGDWDLAILFKEGRHLTWTAPPSYS